MPPDHPANMGSSSGNSVSTAALSRSEENLANSVGDSALSSPPDQLDNGVDTVALPRPEDCLYQSCYCEENIWHLCQHPACADSKVVFIASQSDMFPMLCQQAMGDPNTPVCWDYHVILMLSGTPARILDFDTTLPFCTELKTYLLRSFPKVNLLPTAYQPCFRLVPAIEYISTFRSDRSHMRSATGWSAPPPEWPTIGGGGSNLAAFRTMSNENHSQNPQQNLPAIGKVLSFQQMLAYDDIDKI